MTDLGKIASATGVSRRFFKKFTKEVHRRSLDPIMALSVHASEVIMTAYQGQGIEFTRALLDGLRKRVDDLDAAATADLSKIGEKDAED